MKVKENRGNMNKRKCQSEKRNIRKQDCEVDVYEKDNQKKTLEMGNGIEE